MSKRLCFCFALIACFAYAANAAHAAHAANTIVINANVITVDAARPAAQAFAIDNGQFTAGRTAQCHTLPLENRRGSPEWGCPSCCCRSRW
jgi:hypothetical protein